MTVHSGAAIAIVGAGFSGAALAVQLARQWRGGPLHVSLIELSGRFAAGVAYGTSSLKHLLNVPAGAMSALPDDPQHFVRWGQDRGLPLRPETFAPRRWYGEYLAGLLAETVHEARERVRIDHVATRVMDVIPDAGGAQVRLADRPSLAVQRVVLALGNFPPADPPGVPESVLNSPLYTRDPWRTDALADLPRAGDILLIGTGLTAFDVTLELYDRGFAGRTHAVSRRGLLPQPHRPPGAPQPLTAPPEVTEAPRTIRHLLRGFRSAVRRAASEGYDWRDVLTALRPLTPALWQSLAPAEKTRFLRHVQPFWDTHRHRIPPEVAVAIDLLREQGRFIVHRGRIHGATQTNPPQIRIRPRGAAHPVTLPVARVINCTGPAANVRRISDPLVESLLKRGVLTADASGLGFHTTLAAAAIDATGTVSPWLSLIGPLRKGLMWEGTAVPELRGHAAELAARLCRELTPDERAAPRRPALEYQG